MGGTTVQGDELGFRSFSVAEESSSAPSGFPTW